MSSGEFWSICTATGQQRIVHTCWLFWCVRREDGASVSLPLNGTLDPRRVRWHFIEQLWPFNCALITFMSRDRQRPQNNPPSFMNSPLGHCQSRPSPGTLAAPSIPSRRSCWLQHCHGSFCRGICLLSHVGHVGSKQGALAQLGVLEKSERWGGEQSWLRDGQPPKHVSPHQLSMDDWEGSQLFFLWQVGLGGSRLGVLSSQRLPSLEMLHCTHFLF